LSGSDFRGADFSESRFQDDLVFDGAVVDEFTRFDDCEALRPYSRLGIFSNYKYERGKFVRRAVSDNVLEEENVLSVDMVLSGGEVANVNRLSSSADGHSGAVKGWLRTDVGQGVDFADAIFFSISCEIARLERTIPNDPDRLDAYRDVVGFLQNLANDISNLGNMLRDMNGAPPQLFEEKREKAEGVIYVAQQRVGNWLNERGADIANFGVNVGLIGLGTTFFTYLGVPPLVAFGSSGALLTGKTFVDHLKVLTGFNKLG